MRSILLGIVGAVIGTAMLTGLALGGGLLVALGAGAATWVMMAEPGLEAPGQQVARLGPTEVVITGVAATDIRLDGTSLEYDPGSGWTARVAPGTHTLRAHNFFGKEVASTRFTARRGHRSLLRYEKKKFTHQGTTPTRAPRMRRGPAPAPVAAPQPVVAARPVAAPSPRGFSLGGFGLTGGTESTHTTTNRSSSEQYGEVSTSGPGRRETHGYRDAQSQEDRRSRRSVLGF